MSELYRYLAIKHVLGDGQTSYFFKCDSTTQTACA